MIKILIKSKIIINFKDKSINDFYSLNASTTGHKIENIRSDEVQIKLHQYEKILEFEQKISWLFSIQKLR